MQHHTVLLTFDLEEFDIPNEYGSNLSWDEQLLVGRKGMEAVLPVLDQQKVTTTIFTTAAYALENKEQVKYLSQHHEIASHTYHHSSFQNADLNRSRLTLEEVTGKPVAGLRMPRMRPVDMAEVKKAGFEYDSSINPTYIPGKYNNRHLPKVLYKQDDIYRFPCTVSPRFRIPLFWLAFKNFPFSFYRRLLSDSLKTYGYVNLYFHPWEFTDISGYKLPGYVKKDSGYRLVEKLHTLITYLKKEGEFSTMLEYLVNTVDNKGIASK